MSKTNLCDLPYYENLLRRRERWGFLKTVGCTVWFTGLPGSGKSTIATQLERRLVRKGRHAVTLDADFIRLGLNRNLGYTREDRAENIRRIGEVSKLFATSGCIVIAAFISPYALDRENVRRLHKRDLLPFYEVFIDAPLSVCERRDPKGCYRQARKGLIKEFTGIDDPYEPPGKPDLVLRTAERTIDECVETCLDFLDRAGIIGDIHIDAFANRSEIVD